jgi:hypothetical protein
MIIAREEGEGQFLQGYRKQFTSLQTLSHNGPLVLLDGKLAPEDIELAARITARYSQGRDADAVDVEVRENGVSRQLTVPPMAADQIAESWHV